MNLELLIKLVKLANNNPNDNEANLAARKVCKMIAEADYKFGSTRDPRISTISNPPSSDLDWLRKYYENKMYDQPKQPKQPKYNPTSKQEEFYKKDYKYYGVDWTESERKKAKETNEKRSKIRTCSKCGLITDTYNIKEPFVCFACNYGEHNRRTP